VIICIVEHVQWRWALNSSAARGQAPPPEDAEPFMYGGDDPQRGHVVEVTGGIHPTGTLEQQLLNTIGNLV
jgi:hypothetical protein